KGGVWFSLIDKVWQRSNLESSFAKVKANQGAPGVDGVTVAKFEERLEREMNRIENQLKQGEYRPDAIRRAWIPKGDGRMRPLGIPTVRDRVVQTALRNVLEPIFEREFAEHSYGFRPGRGAKDALRRLDQLLKAGYRHVVDADIQGYFDSIPQDKLRARLRERIADGRVLSLLDGYLSQPVMESLQTWTPEQGTPQGAVISPLLANIYLNPLDHEMASRGMEMVRYADDFVVMCRSRAEAETAMEVVRVWMKEAGLCLHPDKTRLVDMETNGSRFEFLGYRFNRWKDRDYRSPRAKSAKKLKDAIRQHTRRTNGLSMEATIAAINPILKGWFGYFKHSCRSTFPAIDSWVRMRLRSILRKRAGGRGRGRGSDNQKWPNKFFADCGLFCLETAYGQAVQSLRG
ncbi:MAG: group II intron reverse transcriptase/maturase, partial [Candidatus Brocadiia bacterium]